MKKILFTILLCFTFLFGFGINVIADTVPSTITTTGITSLNQYISGFPIYLKQTNTGLALYCQQSNLNYPKNMTLSLNSEVPVGFIYMLNNKPNTGDANKDYYIMQTAVWMYKDVYAGTSNLTTSFKNTIINNRGTVDIYNRIYQLVEGAKNYSEAKGTMSFSNSVSFSVSGNYFVSDVIKLNTTGLSSYTLKLNNSPSGAEIINDNKANKSFQIRVPVSSINEGFTKTFSVTASSSYTTNSAYDYKTSNSSYQVVILDKVFSTVHNINATLDLSVTREKEDHNELIIIKKDDNEKNVLNAQLSLYKGDCTSNECKNTNLYKSWTTKNNAETFKDIPVGTYTLVETKTPTGYKTADKMIVKVTSANGSFKYTMIDVTIKNTNVKISKVDNNGKVLSGATLVVKDSKGKEVESWVSDNSAHVISLSEGVYSLTETKAPKGYILNNEPLAFKVTRDNEIYQLISGKYVKTNEIKMSNVAYTDVKISKTDITGTAEIAGATLLLKNQNGNVVDTWVSTNNAHYVTLTPGIYFLTETIAPKGYILNTTTISFKVDDNNKIYEYVNGEYKIVDYIKMVNEKITPKSIKINKLDADTKEYVSDAILKIVDIKGNTISVITTSNTATYVILDAGTYIITEEAAPKGYDRSEDTITFEVDDEGNIKILDADGNYVSNEEITFYNTKSKEEIIKVPITGLSSTISYVIGACTLVAGAIVLFRNGKQNI